ncbi:DUF4185 domain-containing protein [Microbacterium cremeum]|uniref:DUF4185 domain-containing protein n=1 Tax=Microbacterium cremeum TaxID=2782169 RepID=UPI001887FC2B|nr:DUF4185 domain-containing protein [Microbacterium cremeum]
MRSSIPQRRAAAPLVVAAAVGALLVASPANANDATASGTGDCELVDSTITATAAVDQARTAAFTEYGDSGAGWTGGDSTYSLELEDGRQAWFFSDTFLGPVDDDLGRPLSTPFLNNSIVVDDGAVLSTVTGGTPDAPESIVGPTPEGNWHWVGDPELTKHGDVQIPLLQFEKFGPGMWDWGWKSNRLATLDGSTLALKSITELPSSTGVNWGSWTLAEGNTTYIYGIDDIAGVRSAFLARVAGGDLSKHWMYWNGTDWSPREADAVPVASYVANEFSVAPYRDGYLMVTQDTSEVFSTRIVAQVSCSPMGPFEVAAELYRTPETGLWGSYGNANIFTYNAHEHPEDRDGDSLLVTYNVNSFDSDELYDDVSIYRPRFIDVQLTVTP